MASIKYWLGAASKNHVIIGVEGGFAQLCHGKAAPLNRMQAGGDGIIYYCPKLDLITKAAWQEFTALGTVLADTSYQVEIWTF